MVDEAKILLNFLGVPVIDALEEGEAQASVMANEKLLDGVVSQDFDCILFGANDLYRNVGFSGKRKVPGKNFFVDIKPEHINSQKVFEDLGIDRKKLIWLGILVGTDFNDKFPRVGTKTALKLVKEHNSFEDIIKATKYEPNFDFEEIQKVFLNPVAKKVSLDELKEKMPDKQKLMEFLVEKHDFSKDRINNVLNRFINKKEEEEKQKDLGAWF
jgi:flap endonuclease-1